jgi:peptidoglycan/LPS O-acetylase OafA/YrhL
MKRITQLDGIRGIAILMVLVWHYFCCQVQVQKGSPLALVNLALSRTYTGVDLFFVLSGFLIGGILLDNKHATNYFRVFYTRRVCRIFPLYYLLLLGFVLLPALLPLAEPAREWLFRRPISLASYATFTQNIAMGSYGDFGANWLGITWSLAVEEQFYLIIPLLIYVTPRKRLAYVLAALILLAPVLRWRFPGFAAEVNAPFRADALLSGVLLALLVRSARFMEMCRRHRRLVYLVFSFLLAGVAAITVFRIGYGAFTPFWLALLYATLILLSVAHPGSRLNLVLSNRVLVWFGTLSYGIYMYHQGVSGILHGLILRRAPVLDSASGVAVTLSALVVTMLVAALSFRFIEQPILSWGHRSRYSHEAHAVAFEEVTQPQG